MAILVWNDEIEDYEGWTPEEVLSIFEEEARARWFRALAKVTIEQWKAKLNGLGIT